MGEQASTITTAMVELATSIATDGVNMLVSIIPVLAPIVGAAVLAGLGYKFVKRFTRP